MDINAGLYLDGEPMPALVTDAFETVLATVSGKKTKGEHAGHSQVSLWRNWRQTDTSQLAGLRARTAPDGIPLPITANLIRGRGAAAVDSGARAPSASRLQQIATLPLTGFRTENGYATERVGLILPTSLCATQMARMAAERLNARQLGRAQGISRFVAFTHTEGCGFGGETMYRLLQRTYHGYIVHPNVAAVLLLEHGCEKIPNDVMRRQLESAALPLERYGWASVQLDGGIQKALAKIETWFESRLGTLPLPRAETGTIGELTIGMVTQGALAPATARTLACIAREIVEAGGSVLLPESDALLADSTFRPLVLGEAPPHATLAYGQPLERHGLHIVASETDHVVENITGFGGNGAHLVLTIVGEHAQQGHPLVPVIQVAEPHRRGLLPADDIDVFLSGDSGTDVVTLTEWMVAVAQRERVPVASAQGFVDFQLTRGLLGLTT
jgi:altronate dehydratase